MEKVKEIVYFFNAEDIREALISYLTEEYQINIDDMEVELIEVQNGYAEISIKKNQIKLIKP